MSSYLASIVRLKPALIAATSAAVVTYGYYAWDRKANKALQLDFLSEPEIDRLFDKIDRSV